jgi:7-carboxy-7-deazaguanine synthase
MKIAVSSDGLRLPITERFYTIQGEGHHWGRPAYFIRLAGCDVGCFWCDVPESWETSGAEILTPEELTTIVLESGANRVVITGGEPTMHNLTPLTQTLKQARILTHIETSGAHPLTGSWDWVCFSPKKFKASLPEVAAAANELKVIVYNRSDFDFAEKHKKSVPPGCELFLQPEWSRSDQIVPEILNYVRSHPEWRIGLQMHKTLGIP